MLFLVRIATFALLSGVLLGCEDRRFEAERIQIAEVVGNVLVKASICRDIPDCSMRNILFVSPSSGGVSIEIYSIQDKSFVGELIGVVCGFVGGEKSAEMTVEVVVYRSSFAVVNESFDKRKFVSFSALIKR